MTDFNESLSKGKVKQRSGRSLKPVSRLLSFLLRVTFLGLLVISSIVALNQFTISRHFPITTVRIYGVNRSAHEDIQNVMVPLVKQGFFAVNVEYIRDRLIQMPWIANLNVRRVWPDQVEITVVEKNAIARWNQESLLSDSGELFSPSLTTYPTNLPSLAGPSGKQVIMLQYFNEINRVLSPLHAKISYLELTPYFTWKLTLDNGIMLQIGHKDVLTRLTHFVKVYPKIVGEHAADVDYVDLRYPNGMAVRWKTAIKT